MSLDLDIAELWRFVGVLDVAVLLLCGMYLHLGYRGHVPNPLWRVGFAYGAFLFIVAVGLVANWLSPYPPTPGAKIVAVVGSLAALYVVRVTVRIMRGHEL